jgi:hypothetical protein
MYPLQLPCGEYSQQPSCPRYALLQLQQVTNTLLSPHWWSGMYMAVAWNYTVNSRKWFCAITPIGNDAETSFLVSKLIVEALIESIVFSHTSISQSEWWYRYWQGDISLVTSCWHSSIKSVQKLVAYWSGAIWQDCSATSAGAADCWSASLVVCATAKGLKHEYTYCVDSCFWDVKLLDCHTQNFVCYIVSFLRQFVDMDWVGVLAKNSAKQ